MNTTLTFYTIGHSTHSIDEFIALLKPFGIQQLIDVRSLPGSNKFPQFNSENLAISLAQAGIDYVYQQDLGGLRKRSLAKDDRRNALWRNKSFRNYADYALSEQYLLALDHLEQQAHDKTSVIMCAEVLWWRCHRRIISDYLLMRGHNVWHIMPHQPLSQASLTTGAVIHGQHIHYPETKTQHLTPMQ